MVKHYRKCWRNGKCLYVHRLVLAKKLGKSYDELLIVDHIDGDIHNNHPDNLREVTQVENGWNTKLDKRNKFGQKGVSFDKSRGKFMVNIKDYPIKRFKLLEDAIEYAQSAIMEVQSDYARRT